jgi:enoyl-CoA hydratase/carnithine racemase
MLEIQNLGKNRLLRLARPPANALNLEVFQALDSALETAVSDSVGGIVLSGAPGMFSAGLDVPALLALDRPGLEATWRAFFRVLRGLAASPVPIAAAITGHSPAGGAVLALFCDYRVMAEGRFKIGLNEVQVGLYLPPTLFFALERLVGTRQAEKLAVTGELVDAATALRLGLVDETAAPEAVEERALAWCSRLQDLPPHALAGAREVTRRSLVQAVDQGFEEDLQRLLGQWFSDSTQSALRALVASLAAKKG